MASDRARRSFDAGRMYRSVVSQQGRVTLEADVNEAEEIRAVEARAELVEIVGPTGTPDDGFKISAPGGGDRLDFAIGQGALYLGGVRVTVPQSNATYLRQKNTEWVDYPAGAPAPYPDPAATTPLTELVYLAVTEQDVSAVEDRALREVALGGPDTSARTRMIQRVHRAPMTGDDCVAALREVLRIASPGLAFDAAHMRLASTARLKVDFLPTAAGPVDACQPTAQPGFLGAENQLIRVQVTSPGQLLWGYDNASSVYRVVGTTTDAVNDTTTIQILEIPVDVHHRPKAKQWAEILSTAVNLGGNEYVASAVGAARRITGYDPTANTVTVTPALPAPPAGQHLFLRMWESRVPFTGDTATSTELSDAADASTGVVIFTQGTAVPGDYWMIGVRPNTPQAIYPARLKTFQSPDGPNRWATPLARIRWDTARTTADVHDCRHRFDDLVDLTRQKCCELKVSPGENVQRVVNEHIKLNAARGISGLHVRFAAGVFSLERPLVFDAVGGGHLTVSGCGLNTEIVAETQETALVLRGWQTASVNDLSVSTVIAEPGHGPKSRPETFPPAAGDEYRHLGGAITLLDCRSSNVERVFARCGSGVRRAATCVTIRNGENRPGEARVRSCEFFVGMRQTGTLLVNVTRATVEDNQIQLNDRAPKRPDDTHEDLRRLLMRKVRIDSSAGLNARGRTVITWPDASEHPLRFITDAPGNAWRTALDAMRERLLEPGTTNVRTNRERVRRVLTTMVDQVLDPMRPGPLALQFVRPLREWITSRAVRIPVVAQGIVVGGARASDVRILHNTIAASMDGIRVGFSTRGPRGTAVFADRVQIAGNTISVRVPKYEWGAHAGIVTGNIRLATVRDNHVDIELISVDQGETTITRRVDAIHAWGAPGQMLLVTGNSSRSADVGVHVRVVGTSDARAMRLVTQNVAIDSWTGTVPQQSTAEVTIAADNVP